MSSVKEKTLRKYSSDLLSLQRLLLNAVKKQQASEKVTQKEAVELLHQLNLMLTEQAQQLESAVEYLGGNFKEEIKSRLANFTGSISGLADSARKDPVSKMLRDDYTALSMLVIGYQMLFTTALVDDSDRLSEITENHLSGLTQMVTETSKVIPVVVAKEQEENPERAAEIGKMAVKRTHRAWKAENINAGPHIVEV